MFKQRAIIVLLVASIALILAGYGPATPQEEVTTAPPTQVTAASVPTTAPETEAATAPTAGEGQGEPITITKWDLWASGFLSGASLRDLVQLAGLLGIGATPRAHRPPHPLFKSRDGQRAPGSASLQRRPFPAARHCDV